jgi:hypothetical protein
MKTLVISFCALFTSITVFAQGLVNFANTPSTAVYVEPGVFPPQPYTIMSGPPGAYYFELFLGTPLDGKYTSTGLFATNTGVDGLFSGGTVAVPGWGAGTSKTYYVLGWDAGMGHDFNPRWVNGSAGDFGSSTVGTGVAGDGSSIPVLNLFDGGGNTITVGFQLSNTLVPEPSITAITVLGAGLILLQRTRDRKQKDKLKTNENTA